MKLLPSVTSAAGTRIAVFTVGALLGAASGMSVGSSASGSQGIVNSIVDSNKVTVHSHKVYGLADQWGTFSGGKSVIGIDRGVVLSSSIIDAAVVIYFHDPPHNTSGNAMLSRVLPPNDNATYDAVTLRLSFTCTRPSTRVQFRYVFGSNEFAYALIQGSSIGNDAMGAFLNGDTPSSNIATMCKSSGHNRCARRVPVTVKNVLKSDSYVDNLDGDHDTRMSGFTTPMVATGPAKAGRNKIFITLADVHDGSTGSWLFIERDSFKCLP